ncbi:MAG: ornithine cyclodeaminase family protein [Candidatus Omnitrophica bacterium]|nr:ornithine cyclodeaminase family protein [Candidatus Omnitrophota bacterium]
MTRRRSFKTLLLTATDVKKLLTLKECFSAVESSFRAYGEGRVLLPPKLYLILPQGIGDFRAMPAYLASPKRCGMKWVNVHPHNRAYALPSVMGIIILNDVRTGFPLVILDGTFLTKMRTGAAGAVAAKYLARRNSVTLGLVGCGVQAETQLLFLSKYFKFRRICFWGLTPSNRKHFYDRMKVFRRFLQEKKTIRDAVRGSDILVTTTPSRRPLIRREWVNPGTHINAIGADSKGKEEIDPDLLKRAKIVVDDRHQASTSGEINVPFSRGLLTQKEIYATLGEIVCGHKKGRTAKGEITLFDSTGVAIQDIAVAWKVYQKAIRYGIGKQILFF